MEDDITMADFQIKDSGLTVEDFALVRLLGTGSYGKVFLSKKIDTGRIYAIKSLKKKHLIKKNQVEHTIAERSILENMKHPFIIELAYAFQTKQKLFFVLEYCPGGELFYHLSRIGSFDEKIAKFYSTQIVLALAHLHQNHIVYRDLKPENVLIDRDGYVKLTDFGLSKENISNNHDAKTLCGTPEYLAPEVIDRKGHGRAVDWWSLACMIYEMIVGRPPFMIQQDGTRDQLFDNIRNCNVDIPDKKMSSRCKDLLQKLFVLDPDKRLGGGEEDALEIMKHPWFAGVDWNQILNKQIMPPFKPVLESDVDCSNFDRIFTDQQIKQTPESMVDSFNNAGMWEGFTYDGKSKIKGAK